MVVSARSIALTQVAYYFDQESALDAPITSGVESKSTDDGPPPAACEFGICMVDATTATFSLGQFADDSARSRLRTLLAQQLPVEVVVEKVRSRNFHVPKALNASGRVRCRTTLLHVV